MRGLLPLLILALVAGCTTRERANPFDPANPNGGRPAGFVAIAGASRVDLRWNAVTTVPDLEGYRVFRRVQGQADYSVLSGVLDPTTDVFSDFGLVNGVRHEYRLYFVFEDGLGTDPAEDFATPGPTRPWVVELSGSSLLRLSADGRRVASRTGGFGGPSHVAADPESGLVWISDTFGGRVRIHEPGLGTYIDVTAIENPIALAVNPVDHTAWICDDGADRVWHVGPDGAPAAPGDIDLVVDPLGVALDPVNFHVWVCERGGNRVRRILADGTPDWAVTLQAPSRVAVDSTSRHGWVTSFVNGHVVRVSNTGALVDTLTSVDGPIGIAIDARRDRVWVADALGNRLVVYRRAGTEAFRIDGLPGVRDVSIEPRSGEAWAVCPTSGEVVRLSSDGAILARVGGLIEPYGISVDPGVRAP
jgi:DNA-binding beta-propeller fold protein YncE